MAEKITMTEVKALTAALDFVPKTETEVREKIEHMIEVRSRKHDRKVDSKRLANIALGEKFAEAFKGDTFKAKDVADFLKVNASKATAVCKAMGWETIPTTEKVKVYKLAK